MKAIIMKEKRINENGNIMKAYIGVAK